MKPAVQSSGFPWRLLFYTVVIAYLTADLYWFQGPLRKRIDQKRAFTRQSLHQAMEGGWAATVNGEPLTKGQLDQATTTYLFRRGKTAEDLAPSSLAISRRAALWQLIEDTLVRQYSAAEKFEADPAEVDRRLEEFEGQFSDETMFRNRLNAMGMDETGLKEAITEEVRRHQWIEARISDASEVTDEEVRQWYDENLEISGGMTNPPLIRVRHIFMSAVSADTPTREERIRECWRRLESGETDFAELVSEYSEDERTKNRAGDLGWMGPGRGPRDFADIAFGLRPGQRHGPFRTSMGWHIVEVTEARAPGALDFESLKPEILAWLRTERRRYAVEVLMNRLKTVAVIEVFPDNFNGSAALQ